VEHQNSVTFFQSVFHEGSTKETEGELVSKLNPAKNHPQQVARRQRATLFGDVDLTDEVDDRGTPQALFDELDDEFHFTVDVAASRENAKCDYYYDKERSGLTAHWGGERVWCNPPYSDLPSWVRKAHQEVDAEVIVMLIPANRTEQPFWQTYIEPYRDGGGRLVTQYLKGRTKFTKDGSTMGSPNFASVLLVWSRASSMAVLTSRMQMENSGVSHSGASS